MHDLFGSPIKPVKKNGMVHGQRPALTAHARLIRLHGACEGKKCRGCKFLHFITYSTTFSKCEKSEIGYKGKSTDWSQNWQACGLFEQKIDQPITE